jgi:cell division protein FtsB
MSLYDPGSRYRRRAAERKRKMMSMLIFLAILSGFFYWLGGQVVRSSEAAYKQQAIKLQDEKKALEERMTALDANLQTLKMEYDKLQNRYQSEVPTGPLKELADLARQQLKDGIAKDRLEFVIRSAQPPRNCTEPDTKRFVTRTPFYSGPDSFVSFVNKTVTITASGEPAVSSSGNPESWYDPGKPVKVSFTRLGGKEVLKEGLLPIHHSMVIGDKEHRFTIAKGQRSFIDVTSDSCDYP